jgi:hypothetical protein
LSNRLELLKHLTIVYKNIIKIFKKEHKLDIDLVLDKINKIKIFKLIKKDQIRLVNIRQILYLPI